MSIDREPTRLYQSYVIDSSRWAAVTPRLGDIVISTPPKAGTTWAQNIVGQLIFRGADYPHALPSLSPWVEMRLPPLEELAEKLEAQRHRRFMKAHLAADGLPLRSDTYYVIVGRDFRDAFLSYRDFRDNWHEDLVTAFNESPGRVGPPLPPKIEDLHADFETWLTRGWFDWESDGYPMLSHLHHLASWWELRDQPNVHLMNYGDMLADLPGEVERLAEFLGVGLSEGFRDRLVAATSFSSMKRQASQLVTGGGDFLRGGAEAFFAEGRRAGWRGVLSADDLRLYDRVIAERLDPQLARWVHEGRNAL